MKKLLFALLILVPIVCLGQNKKFIVLDESLETPIEYCSVLIINKDKGVYSDSKGLVKIKASANDSLVISHVLYNDLTLPLSAIKDTVWLSQKNQYLDEVVVSSKKDINPWSKERKVKHKWYIQPKTEFCVLLKKDKHIDSISKVRFPIENLNYLKNSNIERAVFRLNIYSKTKVLIGERLNTGNLISSVTDNSKHITFSLQKHIVVPLEGLFLGVEFIGFENEANEILAEERNNFIKLNFASTKRSSTFYANKFINNGKWSLLTKNNAVFPFQLKSGLSLIFAHK